MIKKRNIKKPTGRLSLWRGSFEYQKRFADSKEDIEANVVSAFIQGLKQNPRVIFNCDTYKKLPENDFDFEITYHGKKSFLELTEFTPFDMKNGYKGSSNVVDQYEQARKVIELILKKSENYKRTNTPIDLLCYITEYNAHIASKELVQFFLQNANHVFRNIFFFVPITADGGPIDLLFPICNKIELNPEDYKGRLSQFCIPTNSKRVLVDKSMAELDRIQISQYIHVEEEFNDYDVEIEKEKEKIENLKKLLHTDLHSYLADLLSSMNRLAILFGDLEKNSEVEKLFGEALELVRKYIPDDASYAVIVSRILNNYGFFLMAQSRMDEAKIHLLEALEIRGWVYKNDTSFFEDFAHSLDNSAIYFEKKGEYEKAKDYYYEALRILLQNEDRGRESTFVKIAIGLNNLAGMHVYFGEDENTESDYLEALNILDQLTDHGYDKARTDVAFVSNNFATFLKSRGDTARSEKYFKRALEIYESLAKDFPGFYDMQVAHIKAELNMF